MKNSYDRIYRPDHAPLAQAELESQLAQVLPGIPLLSDWGTRPAVVIAGLAAKNTEQLYAAGFLVQPLFMDSIQAFVPTRATTLDQHVERILARMDEYEVQISDLDDSALRGAPDRVREWWAAAASVRDIPTLLICLLAAEGNEAAEKAVLSWKTENL